MEQCYSFGWYKIQVSSAWIAMQPVFFEETLKISISEPAEICFNEQKVYKHFLFYGTYIDSFRFSTRVLYQTRAFWCCRSHFIDPKTKKILGNVDEVSFSCPAAGLHPILKFAYSGALEITEENLFPTYLASTLTEMKEVK